MKHLKRQATALKSKAPSSVKILLIATILFSASCDSMKKHYKKGNRYLEEGRYDEAVRELSEALDKCEEKDDEPCTMYQDRLAYAKRRAGEHHYATAQKRFAEKDLDQALKAVDQAIHYAPQETAYATYRQTILAAVESAEQLRSQALSLADQGKWDEAIDTMQQALGNNRSLSGGQGDLQQIKRRAHDHYLNLAQQELEKENWDEALTQANRALGYDAQSRRAQELVTQVNNRREARRLISQAKGMLDTGGDPQQVISILERARGLDPAHRELDGLLLQGRQRLCDQKIAQARQALQRQEFQRALDLLAESKKILKTHGDVDGLIQTATLDLSRWHRENANGYQQRGLAGNALLHYLSAIHYHPNDQQNRDGIAGAVADLREAIRYSVGFVGFRSSWQNRHLAARLETATLEALHQIKPPNVSIVDRQALAPLLRNINLHIPDIVAMEFHLEPGRLQEVDGLLLGQILERRITTEKSTTNGKSTYRSGSRMGPNPDYEQARAEVDAAADALAQARERLRTARIEAARFPVPPPANEKPAQRNRRREAMQRLARAEQRVADARRALEAAEDRLTRTPRRIRVPVIVEYHYPITHVTKIASLVCFLKVVDSATGEILFAEEIAGEYVATDASSVGDPVHNVPNDPLTLPSDDYLTDQAVIAAIDAISHSLYSILPAHGKRFSILQRKAAVRGDEENAVENGMLYLWAYPVVTPETNSIVNYIETIVKKRNQGVSFDVKPLLHQYGSVLRTPGRLPGDLLETEGGVRVTALRTTRLPRGLRIPCRLAALNGIKVHTLDDVYSLLAYRGVGDTVTLTLVTPSQQYAVEVALIAVPR
jgi:tetratricopeptide (TPR) repeat protein